MLPLWCQVWLGHGCFCVTFPCSVVAHVKGSKPCLVQSRTRCGSSFVLLRSRRGVYARGSCRRWLARARCASNETRSASSVMVPLSVLVICRAQLRLCRPCSSCRAYTQAIGPARAATSTTSAAKHLVTSVALTSARQASPGCADPCRLHSVSTYG